MAMRSSWYVNVGFSISTLAAHAHRLQYVPLSPQTDFEKDVDMACRSGKLGFFWTVSTLVGDSPVISMSTWRVACFVGAKKGEIVSIGHVMNICCLQSPTLSSNQAHFIRYQLASDSSRKRET